MPTKQEWIEFHTEISKKIGGVLSPNQVSHLRVLVLGGRHNSSEGFGVVEEKLISRTNRKVRDSVGRDGHSEYHRRNSKFVDMLFFLRDATKEQLDIVFSDYKSHPETR